MKIGDQVRIISEQFRDELGTVVGVEKNQEGPGNVFLVSLNVQAFGGDITAIFVESDLEKFSEN